VTFLRAVRDAAATNAIQNDDESVLSELADLLSSLPDNLPGLPKTTTRRETVGLAVVYYLEPIQFITATAVLYTVG
jgi:hypothetical protein